VAAGSDAIGEACGLFGVWAPGRPVARLTYAGLCALQHRGQESAGIAVSDNRKVWVDKGMGLVSAVFDDHRLAALDGHLAIGHTRYSTSGSSSWANAQPVHRNAGGMQFALAHNGNLVNTAELAADAGIAAPVTGSDSELVGDLLAARLPADGVSTATEALGHVLEQAMTRVLPRLRGAFSFVAIDEHNLFGVRDPNGFRPLFLGAFRAGGWVLASETPALDAVGAATVREVEPGEVVVLGAGGVRSLRPFPAGAVDPRLCVFEYIYFARPDGRIHGRGVGGARERMGEELARQAPAAADVVVAVPDSSIPGADGFARVSGIPRRDGFVKAGQVGRTFITPGQRRRSEAVRSKLRAVPEHVAGQRVVVVEDSIVRGTTLRESVRMLRDAGAAEIHVRVLSPPYRWPCFFGMDTGDRSQLVAARLTVEQIRDHLGVASLGYLTLDRLLRAIGAPPPAGFCTACLTGEYPVPVPVPVPVPPAARLP
jgi:amidophosphoribosyltransferase